MMLRHENKHSLRRKESYPGRHQIQAMKMIIFLAIVRLKESSGEFNVLVENYWSVMERDTIEENEREEKKKILAEIKKLERIEDEVEIIKSELKTAEVGLFLKIYSMHIRQKTFLIGGGGGGGGT